MQITTKFDVGQEVFTANGDVLFVIGMKITVPSISTIPSIGYLLAPKKDDFRETEIRMEDELTSA